MCETCLTTLGIRGSCSVVPEIPKSSVTFNAVVSTPGQHQPPCISALRAGSSSSARPTGKPVAARSGSGELWVTKWKPKSSDELVGNNTLVSTVRGFLKQWEAIHIHGQSPKPIPGAGTKNIDLAKFKSILLSGPPGIGKTSSATIIARECGFRAVEVNASDSRGKSDSKILNGMNNKLANGISELCTNTSIGGQKTCIIMDEVDGMSGGDRGGVQELIQNIKKSKIPIICICNDKYSQKLKSLRNHVIQLDFRKPTAQQIIKRAAHICAVEGLKTNDAALSRLIEMTNGDIRMVLNQLQLIRVRKDTFTFDDLKVQNIYFSILLFTSFSASSYYFLNFSCN